jgi:small subunit ribosomal protein S2
MTVSSRPWVDYKTTGMKALHAGMRKWFSRQAHNLKVVGSNPTPALSCHITFHTKEFIMTTFSSQQWNQRVLGGFGDGVHHGHTSLRLSKQPHWHPVMAHYLLGLRQDTALVDPTLSQKCLLRAFHVMASILHKGGHVLVINTNQETATICHTVSRLTRSQGHHHVAPDERISDTMPHRFAHLESSRFSFSCVKWVGGTLTNWKHVSKSVYAFAKFSERCGGFLREHHIDFPRYTKIQQLFEGFVTHDDHRVCLAFRETPDAVFVINPNENRGVIREAAKLHIPVIALAESNTNLHGITYPIPTNTYTAPWVYYCMKKLLKIAPGHTGRAMRK